MLKSRNQALAGAAVAALAISGLAMPAAASAATIKLAATLSGQQQTDAGDPDGAGKLSAEVDGDSGDFCYTLSVTGISKPTAAHIHTGTSGKDGPPVVTLEVTGEGSDECIAVEPETLKPILSAPGNYYVNVHTADFPKGAIRGQLGVAK